LIQQALKALLAGRTALVVAHRLSTVRSADKILVLKKGRIVEKGTHAELIRRGGLYSRLYDAQFARARHAEESGSAAS
jgi:ABC-type multidrug transport system fused ATPase/permease subunit